MELWLYFRRYTNETPSNVELYNNTPLFPGQNDADEREVIFKKMGSPNTNPLTNMPKLASYPEWNANNPIHPGRPLNELVPRMDNQALDLLSVSLMRVFHS